MTPSRPASPEEIMSANPHLIFPVPYFSMEEYFQLEAASDKRHEYWYGQIVCMSGGSNAHAVISANLVGECYAQLKGSECAPRTENAAVKNPLWLRPRQDWPPYVYPDASVICGEPHLEKIRGLDVATNPVLIAEVLSPTTEAVDTGDKFTIYTAIPTLRHYLIFSSELTYAIHWRRDADGAWRDAEYRAADAVIPIERPKLTLALRDIYAGALNR
jgi:Uma2 family endonuclease